MSDDKQDAANRDKPEKDAAPPDTKTRFVPEIRELKGDVGIVGYNLPKRKEPDAK